jgi:hypothetical protein
VKTWSARGGAASAATSDAIESFGAVRSRTRAEAEPAAGGEAGEVASACQVISTSASSRRRPEIVRVVGKVVAADGELLVAPLTGRRCVCFDAAVHGHERDELGLVTVVLLTRSLRGKPFVIDDGSAQAHVDPRGAYVRLFLDHREGGVNVKLGRPPLADPEFVAGLRMKAHPEYVEGVLTIGEEVEGFAVGSGLSLDEARQAFLLFTEGFAWMPGEGKGCTAVLGRTGGTPFLAAWSDVGFSGGRIGARWLSPVDGPDRFDQFSSGTIFTNMRLKRGRG